MFKENRGTSIVISFVLAIAVSSLLLGALLYGVNDFIKVKKEQAVSNELSVNGEKIISNVQYVGSKLEDGQQSSISYERQLFLSSSGISTYEIQVSMKSSTVVKLVMTVPGSDTKVTETGYTPIPVNETKLKGDTVIITYDNSTNTIRLTQ